MFERDEPKKNLGYSIITQYATHEILTLDCQATACYEHLWLYCNRVRSFERKQIIDAGFIHFQNRNFFIFIFNIQNI